MKTLRIIPVLFLLWMALLCACSRQDSAFTEQNAPRHFHELKAVETLLETDPVKAKDSVCGLVVYQCFGHARKLGNGPYSG